MPTYKSYLTGFITSLVFVVAAYALVDIHVRSHHHTFGHQFLMIAVLVLAFVQACLQLRYFLHLGTDSKSSGNTGILVSAVSLIFIIVVGSLWIMNHLNYNMTPQQMDQELLKSEGMPK